MALPTQRSPVPVHPPESLVASEGAVPPVAAVAPRPDAPPVSLSLRSVAGSVPGFIIKPLDRLIGLHALAAVYGHVHPRAALEGGSAASFSRLALEALSISSRVTPADLARIPESGPLIVAANHPLGGADGLLFIDIVSRRRPDLKLLANSWLAAIPELRSVVIPVDVFAAPGRPPAANTAAIREALRWLKSGGCILTFPAGEVSRLRLRRREVADGPWAASLAALSRRAGAPVVPLHFHDANSWLFQALGQVHPVLRTVMLPREMLRKRRSTVRVRVGTPISPERLARLGDDADAAAFVRACVYLLSAPDATPGTEPSPTGGAPVAPPLAAPADPAVIAAEVAALPEIRTLARVGTQRVLIASASEVPATLREIGRLREITFRAVGEGTGAELDLDEYDLTYRHLFVYDDAASCVVGAYRLGLTDEQPPSPTDPGLPRLYTATLFRYDPQRLRRLLPAIELGRSFVRAEYQRQHAPLLLLWQGIGRFVAANPRYRRLFGTASISDTYASTTRNLLVRFITRSFGPGELGELAAPTLPPRFTRSRDGEAALAAGQLHDLDDADRLVASLDPQGRGLPTLLRQYLRLGARLVGFNVDPAFGNALDGLIVVDLLTGPSKLIARYMGAEGYAAFRAYHAAREPAAQPRS